MAELNDAYAQLRSPDRRSAYDRARSRQRAMPSRRRRPRASARRRRSTVAPAVRRGPRASSTSADTRAGASPTLPAEIPTTCAGSVGTPQAFGSATRSTPSSPAPRRSPRPHRCVGVADRPAPPGGRRGRGRQLGRSTVGVFSARSRQRQADGCKCPSERGRGIMKRSTPVSAFIGVGAGRRGGRLRQLGPERAPSSAAASVATSAAPSASQAPTGLVTTVEELPNATIQIVATGTFVSPEFGEFEGGGAGLGLHHRSERDRRDEQPRGQRRGNRRRACRRRPGDDQRADPGRVGVQRPGGHRSRR